MNIPYMRIMGSEYKENQEALKIFENTLIHGTVVCNFPGRIFSTERAENCYQLALTSLFTSPQFRMSKFLSQKFITLMIGAQNSASSLKTLPRDVIKVIVTLNPYFLLPSFAEFNNKFISENARKILTTNDFVASLMNSPLPEIKYL